MSKNYLSVKGPGKKSSKDNVIKRVSFKGLDKRDNVDSGCLSICTNCSVSDNTDCVETQKNLVFRTSFCNFHGISESEAVKKYKFLSLHAFARRLYVVYKNLDTNVVSIDVFNTYGAGAGEYTRNMNEVSVFDERPRTIIRFNEWDKNANIAESEMEPVILVYPDMWYFKFDPENGDLKNTGSYFGSSIPKSYDACVFLSRVFSVDSERVYATGVGFDDYTLDSADDFSDAHAWASLAAGNTASNGELCAVTAYGGHVVVFKSDYMYEIYNNKNPFRMVDVYRVGTVGKRTICEIDGKLYFTSSDGIYCYTGGVPRKISDCLGMYSSFDSNCVAGVCDGKYYLYANRNIIYVYNPKNNMFSEIEYNATHKIVGFATDELNRCFALLQNGDIFEIAYDDYSLQNYWFETDLTTFGNRESKRIKEIRFLAYMDSPSGLEGSLYVSVYTDKDSSWKDVYVNTKMKDEKYMPVKILLRGYCDNLYKLSFSGEGNIKIYALDVITD